MFPRISRSFAPGETAEDAAEAGEDAVPLAFPPDWSDPVAPRRAFWKVSGTKDIYEDDPEVVARAEQITATLGGVLPRAFLQGSFKAASWQPRLASPTKACGESCFESQSG